MCIAAEKGKMRLRAERTPDEREGLGRAHLCLSAGLNGDASAASSWCGQATAVRCTHHPRAGRGEGERGGEASSPQMPRKRAAAAMAASCDAAGREGAGGTEEEEDAPPWGGSRPIGGTKRGGI
jgi:hypothetical protein